MIDFKQLSQMAIEPTMVGVQLLSTPPLPPVTVTVTARNLGVLVQWSKVSGSDGYNILISDTGDMGHPSEQVSVPGQNSVSYFYNTGHTTVTRFFAVQSYKGSRYSSYSSIVSTSTTQAVAGSQFPANTTFDDTPEVTIATVTLTTTGGTLFVIGSVSFYCATAEKAVTLRLKEDGVTIRTVVGAARNSAAHGYGYVAFNYSTPAAGSHTYILTAVNSTDTAVSTADSIGLCVMEIPLLTMAAPPAPPTPAQEVEQPGSYPIGPDFPGGF